MHNHTCALHAPAAALVAVTVLCGSTAEQSLVRPGNAKHLTFEWN